MIELVQIDAEQAVAEIAHAGLEAGPIAKLPCLAAREGGEGRLAAPGERLRADLTICFTPWEAEGDVLSFDASLQVGYDSGLPVELLAALWAGGAVDAASLTVNGVETMITKNR